MKEINYCPFCGSSRILFVYKGYYYCETCGIDFDIEIKE